MKVTKATFIVLCFGFLTTCYFFSFIPYMKIGTNFLGYAFYAVAIIVIVTHRRRIRIKKTFESNVIFLCFLCPFVSSIPCYLFHGQSFFHSGYAILQANLPIIVYWYLHSIRVDTKTIIKMILVFALIWTAIEAIQNITYPDYYFSLRSENSERGVNIDQRNGIWRFMIQPWFVAYFSCVYTWCKMWERKGEKYSVFFFVISLVGIYLYITRVIIASIIVVLFLSYVKINRLKMNLPVLFILSFVGVFLYMFGDILFGELLVSTRDQLENDEDIRVLQFAFYAVEYFPHWVCNLFGNGMQYVGSSYGKEILRFEDEMGLWRADIGVFGDYNLYGLFYNLVQMWTFLKVYKLRCSLENYQFYLFLGLLLGSYIMTPFRGSHLFLLGVLFYLCDRTLWINRFKQNKTALSHSS